MLTCPRLLFFILQIDNDDCLPDVICLLCKNSLELFSSFRNICIQNDKAQRLKLIECLNIKRKEIITDNLLRKNDISLNSSPIVYTSFADNADIERKLTALKECNSERNFHLIENKNDTKNSQVIC